MGYSERYCVICGMSFNIGRIRTADEGEDAAWSYCGRWEGCYVDSQSYQTDGCRETGGCMVLKTSRPQGYCLPPRGDQKGEVDLNNENDDDNDDPDWIDGECEAYEPYDFDTPRESDAEGELDVEARDDSVSNEPEELYAQFVRAVHSKLHHKPSIDPRKGDLRSFSTVLRYPHSVYDPEKLEEHEHIAGPNCQHLGGYNGHRISSEEMRGCTTLQCLVPKAAVDWVNWDEEQGQGRNPELDDEEINKGNVEVSDKDDEMNDGENLFRDEMQDDEVDEAGSEKEQAHHELDIDPSIMPVDEPFEIKGPYFLSGISDDMPSRDMSDPTFYPRRHDCSSADADDVVWDPDRAERTAIPFHPTCLEAFKRASLKRLGKVDIPGLIDWYGLTADYEACVIKRHPAVERGYDQMWKHLTGDEFLAANPCYVPKLAAILGAAKGDGQASNYHRPILNMKPPAVSTKDIFSRLSYDTIMPILSLLNFKDIANLVMASRTFRQLPQSMFHKLLLEDLPWLWEAWCDMDYAWLSSKMAKEVEREDEQHQAKCKAIREAIEVLEQEGGANSENEAAVAALKGTLAAVNRAAVDSRKPIKVPRLPAASTDWFRLYRDIIGQWADLKGLQNRERIWADCQQILDSMEELTLEGRMGNGIVVDFRAEAERRDG